MSISNRGFAGMDSKRQREICSKGGRAAHAKGTAHEFTPDEARQAGQLGGLVVSRNKEHMAAIGRTGAKTRWENAKRRKHAEQLQRMQLAQLAEKGGSFE